VIFYNFKKTIRNEKWEKVKILKKQLKKLIDNYAQGSGSGG